MKNKETYIDRKIKRTQYESNNSLRNDNRNIKIN